MVKWKFKTFIFIYSILFIGAIIYGCYYVWNGLEQYQSDYDAEYEKSDPKLAIEDFMEQLDVSDILEIVENDKNIKVTAFENKDYIVKMYEDNYKDAKFSYVENKAAGNSSKKQYEIYANKADKLLTVSVESTERTEQFGFSIWNVTDVTLEKYYEPEYSITLRVPSTSQVIINGVSATPGESCKVHNDENYDKAFAEEVIKFTGKYERYTYYQITDLYRQPQVQVNDGTERKDYVVTDDGMWDFEIFAGDTFIQSVKSEVVNAETTYADFIARFKEIEDILPYLISGTTFYKETNAALSFLKFVTRPTNVTYENWNITDVKQYGTDKFICNITYTQNVYYGNLEMKYDSDKLALFIKQGDQWKIAYQKNNSNSGKDKDYE